MSRAIRVSKISAQTSEKEVRDFFSFCGKISQLTLENSSGDDGTKSAVVVFEKETAAKTALLLDNTKLGSSEVQVIAVNPTEEGSVSKVANSQEDSANTITQEDKPRSRIFAEYLAHGYVLSDIAINRALETDRTHGISQKFTKALEQVNTKLQASQRAQEINSKWGIWSKAEAGWQGLYSYFDKAAQTPTGVQLRAFYEQGQKQVLDVHNEAKHIAALKQGKPAPNSQADDGAIDEKAPKITPEQAGMEKVEIQGQIRTKCNCGGEDGKCPCAPGTCACSNCSKAS